MKCDYLFYIYIYHGKKTINPRHGHIITYNISISISIPIRIRIRIPVAFSKNFSSWFAIFSKFLNRRKENKKRIKTKSILFEKRILCAVFRAVFVFMIHLSGMWFSLLRCHFLVLHADRRLFSFLFPLLETSSLTVI